jgi:hypothetical protein
MSDFDKRLFDDWKGHCPWHEAAFQHRSPAACAGPDNKLCEKDNCPFIYWIGAYEFEKQGDF